MQDLDEAIQGLQGLRAFLRRVTLIRTADILAVLAAPLSAPVKASIDASAGGSRARAARAGKDHSPPPLAEQSMREIRDT